MAIETFQYDNRIVRNFGIATILWGLKSCSLDSSTNRQRTWGSFRKPGDSALEFCLESNGSRKRKR